MVSGRWQVVGGELRGLVDGDHTYGRASDGGQGEEEGK